MLWQPSKQSKADALNLILHQPLLGSVIEFRRAWAFMCGHLLGVLQCAAVGQIGSDAGRVKTVVADRRVDAGGDAARATRLAWAQCRGSSSCNREAGLSLMRASTSASQAGGSAVQAALAKRRTVIEGRMLNRAAVCEPLHSSAGAGMTCSARRGWAGPAHLTPAPLRRANMPDVHAAILDQTEMKVPVETRGLNAALADAGQMLDYAIARGLLSAREPNAGASIIAGIMQAQTAAPSDTLTTTVINTFYASYERLAYVVRPVTAKSLAASQRASLAGMKALALLLVSGVIMFSIFLFMCNDTLNETSTLIDQQNAAALKLWSDVQVMQSDAVAGRGEGGRRPDGIVADRVFEQIVEFSRKNAWLLQSASRLNFWFVPPWLQVGYMDVVFNAENPHGLDHLNISPDVSTPAEIRKEAVEQIRAYQYIRDYALGLYKINSLIYTSLSTYFLPTVYALLGSFLYGLRFYSRLIKRNEFLPSVANSARYYIAAIAGLVVGLFANLLPKGMEMPPLAAAFLVGYGVEMFFSRLDMLIRRLKGTDAPVVGQKTATKVGAGVDPV
jgi:hypothetical protein